MRMLADPTLMRMAMLLFVACAAFVLGLLVIRRLRTNLVSEAESLNHSPLPVEGLPVHAYHAVIQQLKQQKHELTTQQLSDRRKAKASDTLSSTILSDLACGVLFLNTSGLVRQANSAARKLLGFASPVGLHSSDLFRTATVRAQPSSRDLTTPSAASHGLNAGATIEQALAPAFTGQATVRALAVNYFTREGETRVLEVAASPVHAEDGSLMGTTLILTDRTDIERIRHDQRKQREVSSELADELRNSLTTISGYAQQLACSRDADLARELADSIAREAAELDRTIGSFLGGTHAATAGS
jgi:nitrogen fixation/metabolism regulation signal transduction histidine kinase